MAEFDFDHMLEHGHKEMPIDLANATPTILELSAISPRKVTSISWPMCTSSARPAPWADGLRLFLLDNPARRGLWRAGPGALRDLVPALGLAIKTAAQADIAKTLGRVYLGRDAAEQVLRGKISRGVTEQINTVLWFSDLRGSTAISEFIEPDENSVPQ